MGVAHANQHGPIGMGLDPVFNTERTQPVDRAITASHTFSLVVLVDVDRASGLAKIGTLEVRE
jgi:hypothetical protein